MKVYIVFAVFLLLNFSCKKDRNNENLCDNATVKIRVPDEWVKLSQDSLFSNVDFLLLETTSECLISYIRDVKFKDSLIIVNDNSKRLLVFNDKGKFCYAVGQRGEGPGDYLEVRDFFIRNDGVIEVLDFTKIECYSLRGKHLLTKRFDFLGKDIYCNANNFIPTSQDGYYFWGGMDRNLPMKKRDKNPLLLSVNKDMKIIDTYFGIGRGDGGCPVRFSSYDNKIIVNPYFAEYNIFQFDEKGKMSVRYNFDFGKKNMPEPLDLRGLDNVRRREIIASLENYVLDLSAFLETDKWVCQRISYKNSIYNILYSKEDKRVYVTTATGGDNNLNEFRFWYMSQTWGDKFVMAIEGAWFKMEMDRLSPEAYIKYNLDRFKSVKEDDNPVLVIYTMR